MLLASHDGPGRPRAAAIRRWTMQIGVVALAIGSISACASYEPYAVCDLDSFDGRGVAQGRTIVPAMAGASAPMPSNAVEVTDPRIARKVLVQSSAARRTETDGLRVVVQIFNCTDYPLQVEARSLFLHGADQSAEPPSMWQRLHLPPRTVSSYSEQSLGGAKVAGYLVELREGR